MCVNMGSANGTVSKHKSEEEGDDEEVYRLTKLC